MKKVGEIEAANVEQLSARERYDYFVKWVTDCEAAWGLWKDGWAALGDGDGNTSLPLWPAARYAEDFRATQFADHEVRAIDLDALRTLAAGLHSEGSFFAVFPTQSSTAPNVAPQQLLASLDEYMAEWY